MNLHLREAVKEAEKLDFDGKLGEAEVLAITTLRELAENKHSLAIALAHQFVGAEPTRSIHYIAGEDLGYSVPGGVVKVTIEYVPESEIEGVPV